MSPDANNQTPTFDRPKNEPDLNELCWDPNRPSTTPEGRGVHTKLESGSAQIPGKLCSFVLLGLTLLCLKQFGWKDHITVFWSGTAAPPLPPKKSFMMPDYLTVLPSALSSPPSSQKSLSDQTDPPSPTSKGKNGIVIGDVFIHEPHFNSLLFWSLAQGQLIKASWPEILMWCLSVWESYCLSNKVRRL